MDKCSGIPQKHRDELRRRIIDVSTSYFRRKGIRAVKMDDIAKNLSISKRTLYEFFPSKEDLLYHVILANDDYNVARMQDAMKQGSCSVMDIIVMFYHIQMENLQNVSPAFFIELHKYKRIVEHIKDMRSKRERNKEKFFKRGVEEGYFRSDVDYALVSVMGNSFIEHIMEHKLFESYSLQYLYQNVVMLLLRSFCTEKGLAAMEKLMKREPEGRLSDDRNKHPTI